jgi:hypothetical protein
MCINPPNTLPILGKWKESCLGSDKEDECVWYLKIPQIGEVHKLTPVIPATQESGTGSQFEASPGTEVQNTTFYTVLGVKTTQLKPQRILEVMFYEHYMFHTQKLAQKGTNHSKRESFKLWIKIKHQKKIHTNWKKLSNFHYQVWIILNIC